MFTFSLKLNYRLVASFHYAMVPSNKTILRSDNNLPYSAVPQEIILYFEDQDNFSISQQTNFNNNQLLRKNMFSIDINKNRAIRKSNNSNIKPSLNYEILSWSQLLLRKRFAN